MFSTIYTITKPSFIQIMLENNATLAANLMCKLVPVTGSILGVHILFLYSPGGALSDD
jgi:hypothetical protein